ncbi:MAG: hypothetical protein J7647_26215 [Cyanobacteria bacterium SBLK]|nr:hypothetical protein [Cyanobacteria bacterium SBLK]
MGAFDAFENSVLFIPDTTNTVKDEDEFGNAKNETSLIEIRAFIKQSSSSQVSPLSRETIESVPIEGRCISPSQFPIEFRAGTVIDGRVNGQDCRIRVVPKLLSSMYDEAGILGQKFTGELLNVTAWR